MNARRVMVASLLLLVPALGGARLLHVLLHWRTFLKHPRPIWRLSEGGAALYGGLILMLPLSLPLLSALRVSVGGFWDTASITMLVALVFTRIGCLLNGCCGGRLSNCPIALELADRVGEYRRRRSATTGRRFRPIWRCSSSFGRRLLRGAIFLCVLAAYAFARFVLEGLREHQDMVGRISLHRAISGACVVTSAITFVIAWPR